MDSPRHIHDEGEFCLGKIHHYTDCHYSMAAGSSGLEMNHPFVMILLLCLIVQNKLSVLSARPRKQNCTAGCVAAWSVRSEVTPGTTSPAITCPGFQHWGCGSAGAASRVGIVQTTLVLLHTPPDKLHVQTLASPNSSSS